MVRDALLRNASHHDSSRTETDDRLARASLSRVEGGDRAVERSDGADVRPQPSIPHALDDFLQLCAVGLDDEVDGDAVDEPHLGRADDGHERSTASNQASGSLADIAADQVEHQIDRADVFEGLAVEIDELVRA